MLRPRPPHPDRFRRRAGLASLSVGLALTLLFAISAKWWFGYCSATWLADLGDGTLYTDVRSAGWRSPLTGWCGDVNYNHSTRNGGTRSWSWTWWAWGKEEQSWRSGSAYTVWPAAPLFLAVGAALYLPGNRAARRRRKHQCVRCTYARAGLPADAPCPECGQQAA